MLNKLLHCSGISKYIGGILLIVGTTIGMYGLLPSFVVFAFSWLFILATAFLFLNVNFATLGDVNLIIMASRTLTITNNV